MSFLQNSIRQFHSYKSLAEKAMAQVDDATLLQPAGDDDTNSFVVQVQHLHGNMLSRWTNYLTEDGEKPWRDRDAEFDHATLKRKQLLELWEEGWACVFSTLEAMAEADLLKTIHIRNEAMTAMDGIIRQLTHYAYHVGQIVLMCRQQVKGDWQSLSIPKGGSAAFNAAMSGPAGGKENT